MVRGHRGPTLTEHLSAHYAGDVERLQSAGPQGLVVAYVRTTRLGLSDPRQAVLDRVDTWVLSPSRTLGMGRAPKDVDEPIALTESLGPDASVARTACKVWFTHGTWWLTNLASKPQSTIMVTSPGCNDVLTSASGQYPLRRRRVTVTVNALDKDAAVEGNRGERVEHRLTLINRLIPDDMPRLIPRRGQGSPESTKAPEPPNWKDSDTRLLAAWAYVDLIGLSAPWLNRHQVARTILRQPKAGDRDPNERVLARLRREAGEDLGIAMQGEAAAAQFVAYILERRAWLGPAVIALHEEFLQHGPAPLA